MDIQGRIKLIGHIQDISASFRKREVVVTTDEQYPQHIMVEFTQDKVSLLDGVQVGDFVKIDINLRGREWQSPQGETRYFNTIQGWRLTQATNQPHMQDYQQSNSNYQGQGSAVDAYHQQQQQGGYQNNHPSYGGVQNYGQQQANTGQQFPPSSSYMEEDHDDLPF
ncbi:hypothetical protein AV926_14140 [Myroides marinus]|uniref:DUF3127 domain-containing protein n=1 Tax=Myroides marinus TaxID=703342 RepID=A0A163X911_9FLAO|nr:DUF3127 domain-containing protein [Myroides marinus]KZE77510.1 hypothetical protein AV926_14140 [Myroides marinus]